MNMTPVLASNTIGPLVVLLFLGPIVLGVLSLLCIPINRTWGRRRRWGLVIALIPTIGGALMLFFLLTVRGGAPHFFYIAAAFPLLCGVRALQVWNRSEPL
jgi:hypothetical protein